MTDYIVTDTELISVADAIRAKGGTSADLEWPAGYIAAINAIPTGGVTIVDWATGTDAEIAAMIDAAHNGIIDLQQDGGWAVGDVRTINISAFSANGVNFTAQSVDIVISDFSEYMGCGNVVQFDFKNALGQKVAISGNIYSASSMYNSVLPGLVNALPSWLNALLVEFNVDNMADNYAHETVTGNKLALRSQKEVLGTSPYGSEVVGQLNYYKTADNRKKKLGYSGSYDGWWLRTRQNANARYSCITSSGSDDWYGSTQPLGLAPFGCL